MPLTDAEITALKPDALAPAAIEAKAETVAVGKVNLKPAKAFVLAMLAGAFIAFGGTFFGLVLGDSTLSFAATRVLGGLCFCLGLTLVLCCGAELFTGNSLMVCAGMSKKISWGKMLANWGIVWVGNLVGSLVIVFLVYFSQMHAMNGGGVGTALVSVAAGKMALPFGTAFAKGILCNMLVCLAVWIGFSARTVVDKVAGLLLPITAFVACGFEHCVANMFFLPMGLLLHTAGIGPAAAEVMTIGNLLLNLCAATLGNVVGGAVLVGLSYWFAYGKK
ncbi:MAG: formate/nitrite transporter family protein [Eggerthellaceae bacterium]|nr:formate/nitrite transporter family protein [Eggerthellaceae bacterium]